MKCDPTDLVIFGCRAFAEIAHYYFQRSERFRVVAFTVDGEYLDKPSYGGLPVVAFEDLESGFPATSHEIFVAVGHQKLNSQREKKVNEAKRRGYRLASYISPDANVAPDLEIGENSIVMEHATLQPFVTVGDNSMIWSATRIGFHTSIGNHCWVVSSLLGEAVQLGDNSFVGLNATIAPKSNIGRENIIGAGALVIGDTQDGQVFRGPVSSPSRVPSHRMPNF